MDKPLVLLTAGIKEGSRGLPYLHLYQNYADSVTAGVASPFPSPQPIRKTWNV